MLGLTKRIRPNQDNLQVATLCRAIRTNSWPATGQHQANRLALELRRKPDSSSHRTPPVAVGALHFCVARPNRVLWHFELEVVGAVIESLPLRQPAAPAGDRVLRPAAPPTEETSEKETE